MIGDMAGFDVVGKFLDMETAHAGCLALSVDLVTVDLNLPDGSGLSLVQRLVRSGIRRVVVVSGHVSPSIEADALEAGALACLRKDADYAVMEGTFRQAASQALAPLRGRAPLSTPACASLSEREREILSLIGRGMPNKVIAHELEVSVSTVKSHIVSARSKLSARDRTHAVTKAYKRGFLDAR